MLSPFLKFDEHLIENTSFGKILKNATVSARRCKEM